MKSLRLAVIPGDGIGPELIASALAVLDRVCALDGIELTSFEEPAGAGYYRLHGRPIAPGALERLREADGVLKGPVGLPDVRQPDGTEGGLLGGVLRTGLDTFANVRPVRLVPGVDSALRALAHGIDYVVVRENTEGLYLSRGAGVVARDAASDQMMITRSGTERVVRYAFETAARRQGAPADGVRRVTCVDKSNVLRSFAFFRKVFDEVAAGYPGIEAEHLYADAAAAALVTRPGHFDVLVMENFLGDILSDLGAATAGGLGMCGSANIGADAAYFEPIHGSAPDIAGRDRANPASQVLSLALLLEHAGHDTSARRIRKAVDAVFAEGIVHIDQLGSPDIGTRAVTREIVARL